MRGRAGPDQRPTIRDVAKTAGVSLGTVSRVLNAHRSVKPEVRRRVEDAIRLLSYRPNAVAQSMRSRATRSIGCIIRDITIPGLAAFVKAAQDVLHAAGYSLTLANSENRKDRELELLGLFARRQTDAIIMAGSSESDPELLAALETLRVPLVLMDREAPEWADSVTVDHSTGTAQAIDYLVGLGHRRIALLTGSPELYPARERIKGYRLAHAAHGPLLDDFVVRTGTFLADFGFRETSGLLSSRRPPTAIISGGMEMLAGVIRAVRVGGLGIPGDVSIVACSDSDLAELMTPPVTALRWDLAEVGRTAAQMLLDRLEGEALHEPRRIKLPTELILRESCGVPRSSGTGPSDASPSPAPTRVDHAAKRRSRPSPGR